VYRRRVRRHERAELIQVLVPRRRRSRHRPPLRHSRRGYRSWFVCSVASSFEEF
jgi:hypothetical protein